jgi:hypothetical protein
LRDPDKHEIEMIERHLETMPSGATSAGHIRYLLGRVRLAEAQARSAENVLAAISNITGEPRMGQPVPINMIADIVRPYRKLLESKPTEKPVLVGVEDDTHGRFTINCSLGCPMDVVFSLSSAMDIATGHARWHNETGAPGRSPETPEPTEPEIPTPDWRAMLEAILTVDPIVVRVGGEAKVCCLWCEDGSPINDWQDMRQHSTECRFHLAKLAITEHPLFVEAWRPDPVQVDNQHIMSAEEAKTFTEDDEDPEEIRAAFDVSEKGTTAPPTSKPACGTCRFFSAPLSNCHRNPPAIHGMLIADGWPVVSALDWCGEYISESEPITREFRLTVTTDGATDPQAIRDVAANALGKAGWTGVVL